MEISFDVKKNLKESWSRGYSPRIANGVQFAAIIYSPGKNPMKMWLRQRTYLARSPLEQRASHGLPEPQKTESRCERSWPRSDPCPCVHLPQTRLLFPVLPTLRISPVTIIHPSEKSPLLSLSRHKRITYAPSSIRSLEFISSKMKKRKRKTKKRRRRN